MSGGRARGKAVAVIGAGSWGTTLANLLAESNDRVLLWVFEEDLFRTMEQKRENEAFLPGVRLADNLQLTHSLEEAFINRDILLCALPSHAVREIFHQGRSYLREGALIISATKGLDDKTHQTISGVLKEVLGPQSRSPIACLSGPSFAREVSRKFPTAAAIAGTDPVAVRAAQELLARPYFRVYTNPDLIGVELGGATKNVIAIAAGTSDGLGFGHSSRAALITRGLAEMSRLGVTLGAEAQTFSGLAGLGDLVLTCTGDLSRNRQVGIELGRGKTLKEVLSGMRMIAEGVRTTRVLYEIARETGVDMPITEKVYEVLYKGKNPREAVQELMARGPRSERENWD